MQDDLPKSNDHISVQLLINNSLKMVLTLDK